MTPRRRCARLDRLVDRGLFGLCLMAIGVVVFGLEYGLLTAVWTLDQFLSDGAWIALLVWGGILLYFGSRVPAVWRAWRAGRQRDQERWE